MYKNQFIVLIKKNGQPLREINGTEVYIPFNSEYTIELRNDHYRRAIAKVTVDGTDVLGTREIVIPENGLVTLERFISDGNLNKGRKFKFVPLSNENVADPTSPENGVIKVEFWLERTQPSITLSYAPIYNQWDGTGSNRIYKNTPSYKCENSSNDYYMSSCNTITTSHANNTSSAGATVEGGRSNQSFASTYFGEKQYPSTIIQLRLRGLDVPITTADSLYCVNCCKKLKSTFKYCPKCGNYVEIA